MIARILLLLDGTGASDAARDAAFEIRQRLSADLTALCGVDLSQIAVRMPGGIGAAAHKAKLEQHLREDALALCERLRQAYDAQCRGHGVTPDLISFEGDGVAEVLAASEAHDLIVAGFDTAFSPHQPQATSALIAGMLSAGARPALLCPEARPRGEAVVIAYDGSAPAMRALQLFVLSGIGVGKPLKVVSVNAEADVAERLASGPVRYLRRHGYMAEAVAATGGDRPEQALADMVESAQASMLVMGAYGRRGWRQALFGSTTQALIAGPPCPLFIYH